MKNLVRLVLVLIAIVATLACRQNGAIAAASVNTFFFPEGMEITSSTFSMDTLFSLTNTSHSTVAGTVTYYRQFAGTTVTRPVSLPVGSKPLVIDPASAVGQHEMFSTVFQLNSPQVKMWRAVERFTNANERIGVEYNRPLTESQLATRFTFPQPNGVDNAYVLVQNAGTIPISLTAKVDGYLVDAGTIAGQSRRTISINAIHNIAAKKGFRSGNVMISAIRGQVLAEEVVYSGAPGKGSNQPYAAIYSRPQVSPNYLYRAGMGKALPVIAKPITGSVTVVRTPHPLLAAVSENGASTLALARTRVAGHESYLTSAAAKSTAASRAQSLLLTTNDRRTYKPATCLTVIDRSRRLGLHCLLSG